MAQSDNQPREIMKPTTKNRQHRVFLGNVALVSHECHISTPYSEYETRTEKLGIRKRAHGVSNGRGLDTRHRFLDSRVLYRLTVAADTLHGSESRTVAYRLIFFKFMKTVER